jgi:hypothetical protein
VAGGLVALTLVAVLGWRGLQGTGREPTVTPTAVAIATLALPTAVPAGVATAAPAGSGAAPSPAPATRTPLPEAAAPVLVGVVYPATRERAGEEVWDAWEERINIGLDPAQQLDPAHRGIAIDGMRYRVRLQRSVVPMSEFVGLDDKQWANDWIARGSVQYAATRGSRPGDNDVTIVDGNGDVVWRQQGRE